MTSKLSEGTIHRRENFLNQLSEKLGRDRKKEVDRPAWQKSPHKNVLKNATPDELVTVLEDQCQAIHTTFISTNLAQLNDTILQTIQSYDASSVMTWKDERFASFGITPYLTELNENNMIDYTVWDHENREKSVAFAEQADVGLTFSDMTLAESATVVLFSDEGKGRSVSLLPKTHIVIIPKSTIVPRLTQATKAIREKVASGETIASCINFISGPSNSADIEMNLVVGVHGPLYATYIVVDDI